MKWWWFILRFVFETPTFLVNNINRARTQTYQFASKLFQFIYTWRKRRFCQTAFSSGVGVRKIIVRLREFFRGVRVKSGAQWAVGLSASLPFGSTTIRNSVAVNQKGKPVSNQIIHHWIMSDGSTGGQLIPNQILLTFFSYIKTGFRYIGQWNWFLCNEEHPISADLCEE